MREEREISVRILTERTGFDMPLAGVFGGIPTDFLPEFDEPEEAPEENSLYGQFVFETATMTPLANARKSLSK